MVTPDNDSDGNAVTLANNANYTLTVSGVVTPDNAWNMAVGSFVVGTGLTATGTTGRSSAQLWTVTHPNMATATGKVSTNWASGAVSVSRGTYSNTEVCVTSAAGGFAADVSFAPVAGTISMVGEMSASLGDTSACGMLGAAQAAQLSTYMVRWTKTDGA